MPHVLDILEGHLVGELGWIASHRDSSLSPSAHMSSSKRPAAAPPGPALHRDSRERGGRDTHVCRRSVAGLPCPLQLTRTVCVCL
eukprot:5461282-Prymnesium_polylepis.1